MRWLYATENSSCHRKIGLGKFWRKRIGLFWVSLLVSSISNQLSHFAIGWQIYELTSSPLQLGLTGVFRAWPLVVSSLTGAVSGNTLAQFRRARALVREAFAVHLRRSGFASLSLALNAQFLRYYQPGDDSREGNPGHPDRVQWARDDAAWGDTLNPKVQSRRADPFGDTCPDAVDGKHPVASVERRPGTADRLDTEPVLAHCAGDVSGSGTIRRGVDPVPCRGRTDHYQQPGHQDGQRRAERSASV
jgi:hypothetical protein